MASLGHVAARYVQALIARHTMGIADLECTSFWTEKVHGVPAACQG